MIEPITTPGKTYAVTSPNGCTVTQHVGEVDIVTDVPAGLQTLIIAHASKFEIDDDSAIVTECGGSAELVFTAATTRAASSGSGCDCGFTSEECDKLKLYASAEGRNIPISEDGEIVTEVGHTYTITAGEMPVKCTDADFNPLCEVAAHKQVGFVAPATAAYVDNVTCTVTEVFRAAAPIMLSGNGSGGETEPEYALPAGYTPVEYFSFVTNQYIDTKLKGRLDVGCISTVKQTSLTSGYSIDFAAYANPSYGRDRVGIPRFVTDKTSGKAGLYACYGTEAIFIEREFMPGKYTASCNFLGDNEIIHNGEKLADCGQFHGEIELCAIPLLTFGNQHQFWTGDNWNGIIYNAKISYGDMLVGDYVPCLDTTGTPCFFDLVSYSTFYNRGSGDFLYPQPTTYSLRPAERYIPEFAQLTPNGVRRLYKTPDWYDGSIEEYAAAYGFKRIVEPEMPAEGYWTPQWRETNEEIVLEWIETEAPEMEKV